jgi:hypothetical protein
MIHIQMPSSVELQKVTIFNNLGQKVLENAGANFSVNTLSSGVHFAQIETSEGIYHKKFIKN